MYDDRHRTYQAHSQACGWETYDVLTMPHNINHREQSICRHTTLRRTLQEIDIKQASCPTWITRMFSPVSWASCSRMWRVGFGVATKAAFSVSSCLAFMVVRGPRLLVPEVCSSFSLLFVSLSDDVELSVSFVSSCIGSARSGDKLLSVHDDTGEWKKMVSIRDVKGLSA